MKDTTEKLFLDFQKENGNLSPAFSELERAAELLVSAYAAGKKLLVCGNGGSASDAEHIVGELMKGFLKKRPLSLKEKEEIAKISQDDEEAHYLFRNLQGGLPAISLVSQGALISAFANDVEPAMVYAQQVLVYGKGGDVLLGLSTSGNSENVVNAAKIAKSRGMMVIGFTGAKDSRLRELSDVVIQSPYTETYRVQEDHIKCYHLICAAVENEFYEE